MQEKKEQGFVTIEGKRVAIQGEKNLLELEGYTKKEIMLMQQIQILMMVKNQFSKELKRLT